MGLLYSLSLLLECVACEGGRVIIPRGVKLSTKYTGSGASQGVEGQSLSLLCLGYLAPATEQFSDGCCFCFLLLPLPFLCNYIAFLI